MNGVILTGEYEPEVSVSKNNSLIVSGLVVGEITRQNQSVLLLAEKGEIKESPLAGVGISNYLDDENTDDMMREIRSQFANDGMKVRKLEISSGKIQINAKYESKG